MRIFFLILLLFVCTSATSQSALAGKTFTITLKISGAERPGIKWSKDELTFQDGSFTSKFMGEEEKFPPFQYTMTEYSTSKGRIIITATGQNPGGSTIAWNGSITGDKIEGTTTWTNRNGPQKQLFKGSIKK